MSPLTLPNVLDQSIMMKYSAPNSTSGPHNGKMRSLKASGVPQPKDCACCVSMLSVFSPLFLFLLFPQFLFPFSHALYIFPLHVNFSYQGPSACQSRLGPSHVFSIFEILPAACFNSFRFFSAFSTLSRSLISMCLDFFPYLQRLQSWYRCSDPYSRAAGVFFFWFWLASQFPAKRLQTNRARHGLKTAKFCRSFVVRSCTGKYFVRFLVWSGVGWYFCQSFLVWSGSRKFLAQPS